MTTPPQRELLIFARHGEEANYAPRPLTDYGKLQSTQLAIRLQPLLPQGWAAVDLRHSMALRAKQTKDRLVAALSITHVTEESILGDENGKGGDQEGLVRFIEAISSPNLLLVTHQAEITSMVSVFASRAATDIVRAIPIIAKAHRLDNAQAIVIDYRTGEVKIV